MKFPKGFAELNSHFFKYGFLPYLYLIYQFEQQEEYEKCKLIKQVIDHRCMILDIDLPTSYGEEAINMFLSSWGNDEGHIALANIPYYAEELRKLANL